MLSTPFVAPVSPPHEGCPKVRGLSEPLRRTHSSECETAMSTSFHPPHAATATLQATVV